MQLNKMWVMLVKFIMIESHDDDNCRTITMLIIILMKFWPWDGGR